MEVKFVVYEITEKLIETSEGVRCLTALTNWAETDTEHQAIQVISEALREPNYDNTRLTIIKEYRP
jgi:hypothetical protein